MILDDLLRPGLRVVFCGTAAGAASARIGAYYAGPGNLFWPTLHAVGFTPALVAPRDFREIERFGLGLTDVCKSTSGNDHEIAVGDYEPERLAARLEVVRPEVVAFTSKRAAAVAFGRSRTGGIGYGPHPERFGGTAVWVLPSPSGAARGHWSIEPWRRLAIETGYRVD